MTPSMAAAKFALDCELAALCASVVHADAVLRSSGVVVFEVSVCPDDALGGLPLHIRVEVPGMDARTFDRVRYRLVDELLQPMTMH